MSRNQTIYVPVQQSVPQNPSSDSSGPENLIKHSTDGQNLIYNKILDRIDAQSKIKTARDDAQSKIKIACCVIGHLSSGKSALLNLAFGTRFQVNSEPTLGPTTLGVNMEVRGDKLIFDVEGFDSRHIMDSCSEDIQLLLSFYTMICSSVVFIIIKDITSVYGSRQDYIAHLLYCLTQVAKKKHKVKSIYFLYMNMRHGSSVEDYSETIKYFLNTIESIMITKYETEENFTLKKYFKFRVLPYEISIMQTIAENESELKAKRFLKDYLLKCQSKYSLAQEVYYNIIYRKSPKPDSKIFSRYIVHKNNRVRLNGQSTPISRFYEAITSIIPLPILIFIIALFYLLIDKDKLQKFYKT